MIMKEMPGWGELATFVPNKKLPVYNWFYYKEGFAGDLVFNMIRKFGLKAGDTVLDPFCGVGTTLLACQEKGIEAIGFDVQPSAVFASMVKTRDYELEEIRGAAKSLLKSRFSVPDKSGASPLVRRVFNRHTLDDVLFFREYIMAMEDAVLRDFFMLALMNVAMKCSYAWKDGAVIKIRKHPVPPLRKLLSRQVRFMMRDIRMFKRKPCSCSVSFGDARKMDIENESIDSVITSPPYLNKIEYAKVYAIEDELFFSGMGLTPLRSHIGMDPEKAIAEKNKLEDITDVSDFNMQTIAYFSDMLQVIRELRRVCRKGAKLGIVVGNGCFPEGVVDSDVILSRMAEKQGFRAKEILVLNKRWCTRKRVEKVGITRESLLVWEK
jgi:DNA modification methylase